MVTFMKHRQSVDAADLRRRLRPCGLLLAAGLLAGSSALAETTEAVKPPPTPQSWILLQSTTHSNGVPIVYPTGTPQVTVRITEIPPGVDTGVHNHPIPLVTYMLAGELTIRGVSGAVHVYKEGDAFVETAEFHHGANEGKKPVRLLAVYAGEVGAPLSIKPPQ